MMTAKNESNVEEAIKLLAEHERTIGSLYTKYDQKFPTESLWRKLAKDENAHADWILSIYTNVASDSIELADNYSREAIWQSIKRINRLAGESDSHSLKEALMNALAIEDMVVEKDFIWIFDEGEPAVAEVLMKLIRGTQIHKSIIETRLNAFLSQK